MTKLATEYRLGELDTYTLPTETYDEDKLGITNIIRQFTGSRNEDKFAGPLPVGLFRPITTALAIPGMYPWAMQWSDDLDWVFLADGAAGAATRRIQMCTLNRQTGELLLSGAITVTFPTATVHTIRGFRMDYQTYTTGTASMSGNTVTGTSTAWQTARLAAGARIGFGSTDPTEITQWYEISAIGGDTSITVTGIGDSIVDGPYVIEELRAVILTTNATAANGGVFLVKGLNPTVFGAGPTAIAAATTVDNIRACYWLKDAAVETNTVGIGVGLDDKTSWTSHDLYVLDTLANPVCFKYNLRAALTVVAGASTDAFVFKSGAHGAVTGTTSQSNNCRLETINHGTGAGKKCLYFVTTTRIYRTADVSNITSGSTTWSGDSVAEYPPGTANTFAATSTMNSVDYSSTLDRFIVSTSNKQYIVKYLTDGTPFERAFTSTNYQLNQNIADPQITPYPVSTAAYFSCWTVGGILYLIGIGTTAITNIMYAIPLGADWEYASASNQRLIFPKFSTLNATSYIRAYANEINILGGGKGTTTNLGLNPDAFKVCYRTSGISDNSGDWSELDCSGDMENIPPADEIQFSILFKTLSMTCIPPRITGLCLVYEDGSTDSRFQPSVGLSSIANVQFAWRHATAFGSAIPRLRVRLYNAVTGEGPLVEDDTTSRVGIWEKSLDGGANWIDYNTDDKTNETTYIRFRPASLGDDIKVKAQLSVY